MAKKRLTPGLDWKSYLSTTSLMEYNCQEKTATILSTSLYENAMGGGSVIDSDHSPAEFPVVPNSLGEVLLKLVCGINQKH